MTRIKKPFLLLLLITSLVISCKFNKEAEAIEPSTPSAVDDKFKSNLGDNIFLPTMKFDDVFVESKSLIYGEPLTKEEKSIFALQKIDPNFDRLQGYPDVKYYALRPLLNNETGRIYLLSRVSEMEVFLWMAIYDSNRKLSDYKLVLYDEYAESAHQIFTEIDNDRITISEYTMNLEDGNENTISENFVITPGLVFQKK